MDTTWLTCYLVLELECDSPLLESLSVVWHWYRDYIDATVAPLLITLQSPMLMPSMAWSITDLDLGVQLALVAHDGMLLRYIHPVARDPITCMRAVRQNPCALEWVRVQSYELCWEAVRNDPKTMTYVTIEDPTFYVAAVTVHPIALKYIKLGRRTYEVYQTAIWADGMLLEYVPNQAQDQYPDLCLTAVTQGGLALDFVSPIHRTSEVVTAAVTQNPLAMIYVAEPSTELLLTAAAAYLRQVAHSTPSVCSDVRTVIDQIQIIASTVSQ